MWTESTMSIGQSLIISAMGISVVFLALVSLALAIIVISKILGSVIKDNAQKPAAVLMATIGEDLGLPTDQFQITSVTEIK